MYPTMPVETKHTILNKRYRLGRNLKVGDLIVARHPNLWNYNCGKRVIGMPGDFVVRDPHLSRTVGGMPIGKLSTSEEEREEPEMIEVPPGHVWVAGDNLSWSRDSRFYGPLPMGMILGKVVMHSHPNSDWMVDMVRSDKDQLRPARSVLEGEDTDGWSLITRSFGGLEETRHTQEFDLQKEQ